jgi:hypothetical protein
MRPLLLVAFAAAYNGGILDPPVPIPLPEMIERSQGIATVRIEKMTRLPPPKERPAWGCSLIPNRLLEVKVVDQIRGNLPESFSFKITLSKYDKFIDVGAEALVFVQSDKRTGGRLDLFPWQQGFMPIAHLACRGNPDLGRRAHQALVKTIRSYRPTPGEKGPTFNAEALAPLMKMLEAKEPELRRFVFWRALFGCRTTPALRDKCVQLLKDEDVEVAASASIHIMPHRFPELIPSHEVFYKRLSKIRNYRVFRDRLGGSIDAGRLEVRLGDAVKKKLKFRSGAIVEVEIELAKSARIRSARSSLGQQGRRILQQLLEDVDPEDYSRVRTVTFRFTMTEEGTQFDVDPVLH